MSQRTRKIEALVRAVHRIPKRDYQGRRSGLDLRAEEVLKPRLLGGVRATLSAILTRYAQCVAATPVSLSRGEWERLDGLPYLVGVSDLWEELKRADYEALLVKLRAWPPGSLMALLDALHRRRVAAGNRADHSTRKPQPPPSEAQEPETPSESHTSEQS